MRLSKCIEEAVKTSQNKYSAIVTNLPKEQDEHINMLHGATNAMLFLLDDMCDTYRQLPSKAFNAKTLMEFDELKNLVVGMLVKLTDTELEAYESLNKED